MVVLLHGTHGEWALLLLSIVSMAVVYFVLRSSYLARSWWRGPGESESTEQFRSEVELYFLQQVVLFVMAAVVLASGIAAVALGPPPGDFQFAARWKLTSLIVIAGLIGIMSSLAWFQWRLREL